MGTPEQVYEGSVAAMLVGWVGYAVPFLFRKKPPKLGERKRDPRSNLGILIQSVSYALVWSLRRPLFTPLLPRFPTVSLGLAVISVILSFLSAGLVGWAVRVLGKQWSFTARLAEGHRLVTEGPYALMRHPIYAAMLGMLLVTAVAISHWMAIPPAILLFAAGTRIRIRSEESLLQEAFGQEFADYRRRVGAVLPRALRPAQEPEDL